MNTPEFILKDNVEWHKNTDSLSFNYKTLFITMDGYPIYHGDSFWTFTDDRKTQGNYMIANDKWNYNDGKPRFKTKEAIQKAIKVYEWLNS